MTENIDVFTQNSIRIRGGKTIYIDPFQMREAPKDADFIFISHDHYDHFSVEDIEKASNGNAVMIVPEKMASKAQEAAGLVGKICTVAPGTYHNIDGLEFDTVPAYNNLKPFHPRSLALKYYPTAESAEAEVLRDGHRVQMLELSIDHMTGKLVNES